MIALPVAHYLADFRPEGRAAASPRPLADEPRSHAETLAEAVSAAEARGREAGLAEARAQWQELIEAERAGIAAAAMAAREAWTADEGARLASHLDASVATIRDEVCGTVAALLAPILAEERQRRTLDELATILDELLARPDTPAMRIAGPDDLLSALRTALGPRAAGIQFETTTAGEISVTSGDLAIATQLRAWADKLGEAAR